jgi:hypothetical protein
MEGNVEGDEKETTRPAGLFVRVVLSIAVLTVILLLSQLGGY